MQKGNDSNSVQIHQGAVSTLSPTEADTAVGAKSFSDNLRLIAIAQREEESEAMRATELLIEANKGLVRSIALRFRERGVDLEDLMQIGTIGIIKAIRSFDLERGTCFSTYAVPMIFGEIRRHLRDEGPIKISRYYKKLGAELMRAKSDISQREGREARISELASICSVSVEEAAIALDAMTPIGSLSDYIYGEEEGTVLEDRLADTESLAETERFFDRMALGEAISRMPPEWQRILTLRYFRSKTQQEVADMLGLSQVKVSREEKKIIAFLREEMSEK